VRPVSEIEAVDPRQHHHVAVDQPAEHLVKLAPIGPRLLDFCTVRFRSGSRQTASLNSGPPVDQAPLFYGGAVLHAKDGYLLRTYWLSRGSHIKKWFFVDSGSLVAGNHLVAFDDDVLNGLSPVGKGAADPFDGTSDPTVTPQFPKR